MDYAMILKIDTRISEKYSLQIWMSDNYTSYDVDDLTVENNSSCCYFQIDEFLKELNLDLDPNIRNWTEDDYMMFKLSL